MPSKYGFVTHKVRVCCRQSTGLMLQPPQMLAGGTAARYHLFTKASSVKKGEAWGCLAFLGILNVKVDTRLSLFGRLENGEDGTHRKSVD